MGVHGFSFEKRVTGRVAEVVVKPVGLIVFQIRTLITLIFRNMDGFRDFINGTLVGVGAALLGADVYSAYSAKMLELPGTHAKYEIDVDKKPGAYDLVILNSAAT